MIKFACSMAFGKTKYAIPVTIMDKYVKKHPFQQRLKVVQSKVMEIE